MTMTDRSDAPGLGHNRPPEPTIPERLADTYTELMAQADAIAKRANDAPKIVPDDAGLAAIGDIGAEALKLWKQADADRQNEKAPYLTAERQVDGFFKPVLERLDRIKRAMLDRATAYNRAKAEAERKQREEAARREREEAEARKREAEQAAADGRVEDAMADVQAAEQAQDNAAAAAAHAAAPAADMTRVRSEAGTVITTATRWRHEITDFDAIPLDRLRAYIKRDAIDAALRQFVKNGHRQLPGVRIYQEEAAQFRG